MPVFTIVRERERERPRILWLYNTTTNHFTTLTYYDMQGWGTTFTSLALLLIFQANFTIVNSQVWSEQTHLFNTLQLNFHFSSNQTTSASLALSLCYKPILSQGPVRSNRPFSSHHQFTMTKSQLLATISRHTYKLCGSVPATGPTLSVLVSNKPTSHYNCVFTHIVFSDFVPSKQTSPHTSKLWLWHDHLSQHDMWLDCIFSWLPFRFRPSHAIVLD